MRAVLRTALALLVFVGCSAGQETRATEEPTTLMGSAEPLGYETGYLVMVPKVLTADTTETICIQLHNMTGPITIELSLQTEQSEVIAATQPYFMEFPYACLDLEVPVIEGKEKQVAFQVDGHQEVGGTQTFKKSKRVWIKGNNWESFIQTDKSIYKPGQTVKFRMLTVDQNLRPDLTPVSKIWVEAPSGIHMAQWLDINTEDNQGLVDLELPMTSDPPLGVWKIKAVHRGQDVTQTFTVDEYVLPKFEVDIKGPSFILINETRMEAKICAKYTYGQPVRGSFKVAFSVANDGWITRPRATIRYQIQDTGKDGCQVIALEVFRLELNSTDLRLWNARIKAEVEFTEKATGITLMEEKDLTKIATEALTLEFKAPKTFKPGVPYHGKIFVKYPDGLPAGSKTIHLTVDTNEGRVFDETLISPANGLIDFTAKNISIQASSLSLYAVAPGYSNSPEHFDHRIRIRFMFDPSSSFSARPQFSPSGSFIQIAPILQTVAIGTIQNLTIDFTARDAEKDNIDFSFLFMSKGNILREGLDSLKSISQQSHERTARQAEDLDVDAINLDVLDSTFIIDPVYPDSSNDKSEIESSASSSSQFSFVKPPNPTEKPIIIVKPGELNTVLAQVRITPEMMPVTRILVFYVRKDGEVVTDSMTFRVQEVFENEVTVDFVDDESAPGETTTLKVQAAPGSLCGVGVVDKSVQLLGGDNQLKRDKVFSSLDKHQLSERDGELDRSTHCPPQYPWQGRDFFRRKRSIYLRHQTYNDASDAFKQMGLIFLTNIKVETRPCRRPQVYYRGGGIPGPRGQVFDQPIAVPVVMYSLNIDNPVEEEAVFEGNEEEEPTPVTVRTYFPETWLWDLVRIGPETTEAEVEVEVPDTITDWVGSGFCTSAEHGVGVSDPVTLRAFQPFFVSYNLPYSVIRGEEVPVSATVFNYLSECLVVKLTLQDSSDFLLMDKDNIQHVCVCAGESRTASFNVSFTELGMIPIEVHAVSTRDASSLCGNEAVNPSTTGFSDGIRKELLVEAEGVEEEYTINSYFCPQETGVFTSLNKLALPVNVVKDSQKATITLTGDLMGPTLSNLDRLLRIPTGCGEQNMLGMVPNIFVMHYLESTQQLTPAIAEKAKSNMKIGYQRELNYRRDDNSYSAFGMSDPEGSTWLTAFVVRSFAQASEYIYIDPDDLERSINWLKERQYSDTGCFQSKGKLCHKAMSGGVNNELTLTAYVAITLLEAGIPVTDPAVEGGLRCLINGLPNLVDTYTTTQMAYAMALASSPNLTTVMTKLEKAATVEDGVKYWKSNRLDATRDYGYYGIPAQDIEMTGYALLAYLEPTGNSGDALVAGNPIARWIVAQRNSQGGFSSTQDTVIGLQALASYANLAFTGGVSIHLKVRTHPQKLSHSFRVNPTNRLLMQELTLDAKNVPTQVTFEGRGFGCALLQTAVAYNVIPEPPTTPAFTISFDVREIEKPKRCSQYSMQVCTSYTGDDAASNMALLRVKMQTGFVPIKSTLSQGALKIQSEAFRKVEIDGKMISFYFDELTAEQTCLVFSIEKSIDVKDVKDGAVTIMDYYEQSLSLSKMVKLPCPEAPVYLDPTFKDKKPIEPAVDPIRPAVDPLPFDPILIEPAPFDPIIRDPVPLDPRLPEEPLGPLRIPDLGRDHLDSAFPPEDVFDFGLDISSLNQCPDGKVFANGVKKCISPVGDVCPDNTRCDKGYTCVESDTGSKCVDLDECAKYADICKGDSICTNIDGSYLCAIVDCSEGYKVSDHGGCEDINECETRGPAPCGAHESCRNTEGSYLCEARPLGCVGGFRLSPDLRCVDIDECSANPDVCGVGNICSNTEGDFFCAIVDCGFGYTKDEQGTCVDINECVDIPDACGPDETCNNTLGSWNCRRIVCESGYRSDGNAPCLDIDECKEQPDICESHQTCVNTHGSYDCQGPCDLPTKSSINVCGGYFIKYGYNASTNACLQFVYDGCKGKDRWFETLKACTEMCVRATDIAIDPVIVEDPLKPEQFEKFSLGLPIWPCDQPMKTGKCRGYFPSYGYNTSSNACKRFIYGGCDGNDNRFVTLEACTEMCMRATDIAIDPVVVEKPSQSLTDICRRPRKTGKCRAGFRKYGYDAALGTCVQFIYGGCDSNGNNFNTEEDCMNSCQGVTAVTQEEVPVPELCKLPLKSGLCEAHFPNFGYNPETGECEEFIYGGCGGNVNRFETMAECTETCGSVSRSILPFVPEKFSVEKIGRCPAYIDDNGPCDRECLGDDAECPGNHLCCFNGCGYQCVPFVLDSPPDPKPGTCPPNIHLFALKCGEVEVINDCYYDYNCEGELKCCESDCNSICVMPIESKPAPKPKDAPKPGLCPKLSLGSFGLCIESCNDDYSCPDDQKCCTNGCGHTCMPAYDPSVHGLPGECPPISEIGTCDEACTTDADCEGESQICCYNGCGRSCTPFIIVEPLPPKTGQCPPLPEDVLGTCANFCEFDYECAETEMCCSNGCGYDCMTFIPIENPVTEAVGPVEPEKTSDIDICRRPRKTGKCKAAFRKYGYDAALGTCMQFIYGGCDTNGNNFNTEEDCMNACRGVTAVTQEEVPVPELCKLPLKIGLCLAAFPKFGYNPETGECEEFIYGGCGGNVNRFETMAECTETCGSVSRSILPFVPEKFSVEKIGRCPAYIDDNGPCDRECLGDDAECPGNHLCCFNGCGYQCVPFVLENPPDSKPGTCPPNIHLFALKCGEVEVINDCFYDYNCEGELKCCESDCNSICVVPIESKPVPKPKDAPKPGLCPKSSLGSFGLCIESCNDDYSCPDDQKCCTNGCGHTCMPAYDPNVHGLPGECPPISQIGTCDEACTTDADCEGESEICCYNGCGRSCTPFIIVEPLPPKTGQCPPLPEDVLGTCANFCEFDYECAETDMCCSNGCGYDCMTFIPMEKPVTEAPSPVEPVEPQVPKPGVCPIANLGSGSVCVSECTDDSNCDGSKKCCTNGCGKTCMPAYDPAVTNFAECPEVTGLGSCVEECLADSDCQSENHVCCFNGCGRSCILLTPIIEIPPVSLDCPHCLTELDNLPEDITALICDADLLSVIKWRTSTNRVRFLKDLITGAAMSEPTRLLDMDQSCNCDGIITDDGRTIIVGQSDRILTGTGKARAITLGINAFAIQNDAKLRKKLEDIRLDCRTP